MNRYSFSYLITQRPVLYRAGFFNHSSMKSKTIKPAQEVKYKGYWYTIIQETENYFLVSKDFANKRGLFSVNKNQWYETR